MINTSADWKTYAQDNSYFHIKATMTGGSTLNLTDEDFILGSVSFTDSISGMDSIGFGAVITNSFSATLNNSSGKFDSWDWDEITVSFGIIYEDESEEWIQRGVYLIDRPTSISDTIVIKAYDYMDKLNRYFGGMTVTWPVNSSTLLQAICTYCGVDWGAWNCGPTFNVNLTDLTNESTTCRQVVSWVLETVGGHARINPTNNKLYCKCFSIGEWGVTTDYDGGTIDPWSTVTARDGGTIDPWSDSVVIDGGLFAGGAGYSINKIISQNVYIDDVEITGIRAYTYNTVDEFDFTTVGSDGYIISLQNNPVINANNNSAIATRCWNNVQGFAIRPFNAVIFGDPSIEAGDRITWMDTRSNSYVSVITNLTFTLSGEMRISCDAQSAAEHAIETVNPETQMIAGAVTAAYDYLSAKKISADYIDAGTISAAVNATNFTMNGGSINVQTATDETSVITLEYNDRKTVISPSSINRYHSTSRNYYLGAPGNDPDAGLIRVYDANDVATINLNGSTGSLSLYDSTETQQVHFDPSSSGYSWTKNRFVVGGNASYTGYVLSVVGSGYATGTWYSASKEELKENIASVELDARKILENTDIYSFEYKSNRKSGIEDVLLGPVIGKEYNCDEAIMSPEKDAISAQKMVSVLWIVVKDQQKKIDELEERIAKLESLLIQDEKPIEKEK